MTHLSNDFVNSLISRAQKGSGEAAGQLYDLYQPQIYRFIQVRLASTAAAEDLTGEVFLRMVDHLPQYDDRGRPFAAWLYQIARNLLADSYRRTGQTELLPLERAERVPTPDEAVENAAARRIATGSLLDLVADLDPIFREVVELRFLAGLSLAETADLLGESIAAVKSRQHRALQALRVRLPQEIYEY